MNDRRAEWPMPPRTDTESGGPRRVGVELEFGGLELEPIARLVADTLGGTTEFVSRFEARVRDTALGDFAVELDFGYLKKAGREEDDTGALAKLPRDVIAAVAEQLVPHEIVSPPIPMARLGELEPLVEGLRDAGALGSRHSPVYAFGLHMNPEMPALDAATVLAWMRAYLCLHDWLTEVSEVDWSRRATPYIQAFGADYVRRVIGEGYAPDITGLIDDYLAANPDRNRALDMLPLFAHLDEARVRAAVDDERVKPRPTLHYRLPNCDVDRAGWGLEVPWRHWLEVERLASDPARLEGACRAYAQVLSRPLGRLGGQWARETRRWLSAEAGDA